MELDQAQTNHATNDKWLFKLNIKKFVTFDL